MDIWVCLLRIYWTVNTLYIELILLLLILSIVQSMRDNKIYDSVRNKSRPMFNNNKKKRQKIISTILWATNKWVVNKKTINNHRTRTNTFWGFYFVTFLLLSILLLLRSSTLSCESSFRIVVGCVRWDKRDDWSYNLITCVTVQRCTQQQACKIYIQNSMILREPKEKNVPFYFLMTKIPSIKIRFFSLSF